MQDTERNATAFVGDMPAIYDRLLRNLIFEGFAEDLAGRVEADLPRSILELACGTGIVTAKLHEKLPLARIVATDLSEDMLAIARKKLGNAVEWAVVDAQEPPFGDGEFDAVVCQFGIMFFEDKVKAMREARRVLKPGGALHFNTWTGMEDNPLALISHRTLARMFPDDPPKFFTIPFGYADEGQVRIDLQSAGFITIGIERVNRESGAVSPRDAARGLIQGGPLAAKLAEMGVDFVRVEAELAAALKSELGDPAVSPLSVFVIRAA